MRCVELGYLHCQTQGHHMLCMNSAGNRRLRDMWTRNRRLSSFITDRPLQTKVGMGYIKLFGTGRPEY